MKGKKIGMIALVLAVAASTVMYGISASEPGIIRTSTMQFADQTFEESVEKSGLVVIGTVVDVGIKVFEEDIMDTDADGNDYVLEHNKIPRAEVTIRIQEVLKDNVGLTSDTVTFYDEVNDAIGESDSQKARYVSEYAIEYQKGDKGLFLIDDDRGLSMLGYSSYYQILDGKETITTELGKLLEKEPLDLSDAKNIAQGGS